MLYFSLPKQVTKNLVMNATSSFPFKKIMLLMGIILISRATQAQSSSDTTHHHDGMHRHWGYHNGSDSTHKDGMGFHRGPGGHEGFRDGQGFRGEGGMAFHLPGQQGFGQQRFSQHGHGRFGRRGMWAGREGIHYTPEQRKQVMAINKDYHQRSADLFKKDNITLKEYKAGLVALQKEKKNKLAALLTPQQKEEMAARRKRMSENAQVMAAARLERLKLRLNLSDDQVTKIKAGQENLRSQFKAIHENDDLLPQQKMEQMKTLMAKRNDAFKSVLTPDQYSQFEKMGHRQFGGWQRRNG